jgi:hypothetical protein
MIDRTEKMFGATVLFKAHEKCYECGGLAAHLFDGKELCYVASEARCEGEASK